jgi:hypothetical protein
MKENILRKSIKLLIPEKHEMFKLLFIFLLLSIGAINTKLSAQFSLIYKISLNYSLVTSDNEANIYAVTDQYIYKYKPDNKSPELFSLKKFGAPPAWIDASHPKFLILYFVNLREVIILDSESMTIERQLLLDNTGFFDISLLTASVDNGLWFYNTSYNAILKVNQKNAISIKPIELNKFINPDYSITCMLDYNNILYVNAPPKGLYLFDGANGKLQTKFDLAGVFDFQVKEGNIIFFRDGILHKYQPSLHKISEIDVPSIPNAWNIHWQKDYFIVYHSDGFSFYRKDFQ